MGQELIFTSVLFFAAIDSRETGGVTVVSLKPSLTYHKAAGMIRPLNKNQICDAGVPKRELRLGMGCKSGGNPAQHRLL